MVALEPVSRAWLHERIAIRLDHMLADGLLAEVQRLRARGDLQPTLPAMRCVGYRQAWHALEQGQPDGWRDAAAWQPHGNWPNASSRGYGRFRIAAW
jgi:tRNA A37 N6-isopentenylltransferase MiaA